LRRAAESILLGSGQGGSTDHHHPVARAPAPLRVFILQYS